MTQNVINHGLNVVRRYKILLAQPGMNFGAAVKSQRRARTGAEHNVTGHFGIILFRMPRCHNQLNQVLFYSLAHVNLQRGLAGLQNVFRIQRRHLCRRGNRLFVQLSANQSQNLFSAAASGWSILIYIRKRSSCASGKL